MYGVLSKRGDSQIVFCLGLSVVAFWFQYTSESAWEVHFGHLCASVKKPFDIINLAYRNPFLWRQLSMSS